MKSPSSQLQGRLARAALLLGILVATSLSATAGETSRFGFEAQQGARAGAGKGSFVFGLAKGGAARGSARVHNKSPKRLRIRIYGADAIRGVDGSLSVAPFGVPAVGAGRYIRPDVSEVALDVGSDRVVEFSVTRPPSSPGGIGALVAEEIAASSGSGSIDVIERVALIVKVADGSVGPHFSLKGVELSAPLRIFPADATVSAEVTNGTADIIRSTLTTQVTTMTGRKFDLKEVTLDLQPGERREVAMRWESVPRLGGVVSAEVKATWPEGEVKQESDRVWIVPIWLLILLILAEGIYLVRRSRRR